MLHWKSFAREQKLSLRLKSAIFDFNSCLTKKFWRLVWYRLMWNDPRTTLRNPYSIMYFSSFFSWKRSPPSYSRSSSSWTWPRSRPAVSPPSTSWPPRARASPSRCSSSPWPGASPTPPTSGFLMPRTQTSSPSSCSSTPGSASSSSPSSGWRARSSGTPWPCCSAPRWA